MGVSLALRCFRLHQPAPAVSRHWEFIPTWRTFTEEPRFTTCQPRHDSDELLLMNFPERVVRAMQLLYKACQDSARSASSPGNSDMKPLKAHSRPVGSTMTAGPAHDSRTGTSQSAAASQPLQAHGSRGSSALSCNLMPYPVGFRAVL